MPVPTDWMPPASMKRIHVHWTGGGHRANALDKNSYHVLIEADGNLVRGNKSIKLNEVSSNRMAMHTLNANTGAIGVSICCMLEARENPFNPGNFPMTRIQWDIAMGVIADLARRYNIPVSDRTILTHAEVQPNLGIQQRNKWDITRLAFDPSIQGARAVGDRMRNEVAAAMGNGSPVTVPAGQRFRVVGVAPDKLNFRRSPDGEITGSLPEGTVVEKLDESGIWWKVRTPASFTGWVAGRFLDAA